jgi:cytoskeleton protein RodZ
MTEIGRELAEARVRAGLSVEELSRRTKMSVPTLLAIERNQLGSLPGGLYARAMLRAYAREVGYDPEEIVRRFREEAVEHGDPFDMLDRIAATANGKRVVEPLHSADIDAADHRRSVRNTMLFGLVLLFGGAFYVTGGHIGHIESIKRLTHRAAPAAAPMRDASVLPSPAPTPAPTPAKTSAPTAAPAPAVTPANAAEHGTSSAEAAPKSVGTTSDKPVGTAPDKPVETAPEKPVPTAPDKPVETAPEKSAEPTDPNVVGLRLEIHPRESCWVSATADGQRVIYRMLNAGERMQVDAKDAVDLRVGDPSAIAFTINGAAARVLGVAGEAVSIHLTPQNYREYLSP